MPDDDMPAALDDAIRRVYAKHNAAPPVAWYLITAAPPEPDGETFYQRWTAPGQAPHVDIGLAHIGLNIFEE